MPLFPVLEDDALRDMRAAVANCKEFVELRRGGLICFDYRRCGRSTFPDPSAATTGARERLLSPTPPCRTGVCFVP